MFNKAIFYFVLLIKSRKCKVSLICYFQCIKCNNCVSHKHFGNTPGLSSDHELCTGFYCIGSLSLACLCVLALVDPVISPPSTSR